MYTFLDKILKFITPKEDKLKHSYQWSILFFGLLFIVKILNSVFDYSLTFWMPYLTTVFVAIYKEVVHDKIQNKGISESADFFFSVLIPSLYVIDKIL